MFSYYSNFVEVYVSTENDFRVRANGGRQQHSKKHKQIRYCKIINIAESWC